jgi:hypothetical protein
MGSGTQGAELTCVTFPLVSCLTWTSVGQWRNPDDKSLSKKNLEYWIDLAKLLEEGKYNALFLADNFRSHDVYKGSHAPAIESGAQWPLYDPFVVRKSPKVSQEFG